MTSSDTSQTRAVALRAIDSATRDLITDAKTVYSIPELGFNEHKTAAYVQQRLQ